MFKKEDIDEFIKHIEWPKIIAAILAFAVISHFIGFWWTLLLYVLFLA